MDFGPLGCNATNFHGRQAYHTMNEMSTTSWFTIFSLSSSFLNVCLHYEFTLERVVEGRDLNLTAWPVSGFWFIPPRLSCRDSFKELLASISALSPSWGFSMDSHASHCGDSSSFTIRFLLGRC